MTKKELRIERIKEYIDEGTLDYNQVVSEVSEEFSVLPSTVEGNISANYPDFVPEVISDEDASDTLAASSHPNGFMPLQIDDAKMNKGRIGSLGMPETYTVPDGEEEVIHIEMEKVNFSKKGKKTSSPVIQKFDRFAWPKFVGNIKGLGYSFVRTLYVPEGVDPLYIEEVD